MHAACGGERARRRRNWGHPRPRQGTSPPAPPYVRVYEGSPDSVRRTASPCAPCWILYIACWLKNSQVCVRQNLAQTIYHRLNSSLLPVGNPVTHCKRYRISCITRDHNSRLWLWYNSLYLLECFDNLVRCFIFDKLFLGQCHADGSASLSIKGVVDEDAPNQGTDIDVNTVLPQSPNRNFHKSTCDTYTQHDHEHCFDETPAGTNKISRVNWKHRHKDVPHSFERPTAQNEEYYRRSYDKWRNDNEYS